MKATPKVTRHLHIGATKHDVSRVTEVDIPRRALFVEEMADGSLRVTYSKALIADPGLLATLRISEALAAKEDAMASAASAASADCPESTPPPTRPGTPPR